MKNKFIQILIIFLFAVFTANSQIVEAEYFWDTDPGEGFATAISAADGSLDEAIEELLSDPTVVPAVGIHTFNIRIKDGNGNWSPVYSSVISVESLLAVLDKQIIQAEYFWDTDPGEGSATPILALDGSLNEAIETVFNSGVNQPAVGIHKFCVRIMDNDNNWSPIFSSVVSIESLTTVTDKQIVQAEYFWDTDPGEGSATPILALDGSLDEAIEIVFNSGVSQPAVGVHKFCIRIKDVDDNWSPVYSSVVSIESITAVTDKQIVQAEYFWDTDPGLGNGTPILALDGNLDEAIEVVLNSGVNQPATGIHKFNIRVKDMDNNWSPVFSSVVSIESITPVLDKQVVQAEYFWDTDPGEGAGSPILAQDGALDEALEVALNTNGATGGLSLGAHVLYVRVKDLDNNWSPKFGHVVEITDCLAPDIDFGNDQTMCSGDSYILDAGAGFDTYLWSTGETTQTINVTTPGTYAVTATHSTGCSKYDTIVYADQLFVDLPTDTVTCEGEPILLDAGPGFATYEWTTGYFTQQTWATPTMPTVYSVTVTDNEGCSSTDNVLVNINSLPNIDLGPAQYYCVGESTTLDAGVFDTYLWSEGSTTQTIDVSTSGTYLITVTDGNGCVNTDDVFVQFWDLPVVDLGGDQSICSGASVTLDAGAFASYIWSDFSTGQTLDVSTPGSYSVTVTDGNGCENSDAVVISTGTTPVVTLGNDTAVCDGNTVMLDAGSFDSYLWSTGETTQTITVSTDDTYTVTVTNTDNCEGTDELVLTVNPNPSIDLGPDQSLCGGETVDLNPGVYDEYLWNDASTGQIYTVSSAGTYEVTVTDANGCEGSDVITIDYSNPTVDLGGDQSICEGETLYLNAGGYESYLWSDGATTQIYEVTTSGFYSVTVTDAAGCEADDAVTISVDPLPVVDLGPDQSECEGETVTLDAGIFNSYDWSHGESTQYVDITVQGNYIVTVTDGNDCQNSDTIFVEIIDAPDVDLGNDTLICADDFIVLNAGTGYDSYLWSDGSTGSTLMLDSTGYGLGNHYFTVLVTENGCETFEDIVITFDICDGSDELVSDKAVSIYPNPATDKVNVVNAADSEIRLYSVTGALLYQREVFTDEYSMNISGYADGIYLIKIIKPDKVITKELIIK